MGPKGQSPDQTEKKLVGDRIMGMAGGGLQQVLASFLSIGLLKRTQTTA
jgi:hypothetical protein